MTSASKSFNGRPRYPSFADIVSALTPAIKQYAVDKNAGPLIVAIDQFTREDFEDIFIRLNGTSVSAPITTMMAEACRNECKDILDALAEKGFDASYSLFYAFNWKDEREGLIPALDEKSIDWVLEACGPQNWTSPKWKDALAEMGHDTPQRCRARVQWSAFARLAHLNPEALSVACASVWLLGNEEHHHLLPDMLSLVDPDQSNVLWTGLENHRLSTICDYRMDQSVRPIREETYKEMLAQFQRAQMASHLTMEAAPSLITRKL